MIDQTTQPGHGNVFGNTRIALKNGLILTHPGASTVQKHKFTLFDNHLLSVVNSEPDQGAEYDMVVDCSGRLIMPGFVNCHNHTPMSLLRGLCDDLPLDQWLNNYIFPAEAKFVSPDFVYTGAMLSMAEMLLSGTTTVADGYFFMENVARAAIDIGMRTIAAQGVLDVVTPDASEGKHWEKRVNEFLENFPSTPITQPALFCHSPYLCSEQTYVKAQRIASDNNMFLFSHVSETALEVQNCLSQHGLRPFEWLTRIGILSANFIAVHAVHVDDHERELIRRHNAGIVHCPRSNMKLSSGLGHIKKLHDMGIRVSLGTDGPSSNNNLDMLEEARVAALASKVVGVGSDAMGAQTSLFLATQGGAEVLGMGKVTGSLEVGKHADVIVIDLDSPHLNPVYDPDSTLVYSARGSDVRDVFVHGKQVVRDRKITTVDLDAIMKKANGLSCEISRNLGVGFWGEK